jgi:hypothetical protein
MGWRGNIPEFSCAASKSENFPIDKCHNRQKGRGKEAKSAPNHFESGELFSSPFLVCGKERYPHKAPF